MGPAMHYPIIICLNDVRLLPVAAQDFGTGVGDH